MRMTRGCTGPRSALVALGLCALMGRGAVAADIDSTSAGDVDKVILKDGTTLNTSETVTTPEGQTSVTSLNTYFTSGQIGTTGVTGTNVVSFSSIEPDTPGTFVAPSAFSDTKELASSPDVMPTLPPDGEKSFPEMEMNAPSLVAALPPPAIATRLSSVAPVSALTIHDESANVSSASVLRYRG